MRCNDCKKKAYADARSAMIALSRAVSARSVGDMRRECRFYPCPYGSGYHLTSIPAAIGDRSSM